VVPAAAGAAVTIYLAWGAWVSAADRAWLHASAAWWRTALQPGALRVPLVFAALWLLALLSYWWPRRLQPRVVGITTVVTMVVIGGALTTSSLFPCRAGQGAHGAKRIKCRQRNTCAQPAQKPAAAQTGQPFSGGIGIFRDGCFHCVP